MLQSPRYELFPPIEPHDSGMLALDGLHRMYWEECGNRHGIPVVFLHGGPGAGSSPDHRRFFDPQAYRIIVFDQRGAGRSVPACEVTDNTTGHLVGDIERLRAHLGVDRWLVFGGSWGSTLALAYAQAHAQRCLGLVLRGIFLSRPFEIEWFLYGLRTFFPEAWRAFSGYLPPSERHELLAAYHRRLIDPDPAVHLPAAHAWSNYEGSCSTLLPARNAFVHATGDRAALALARIEAHYFMHGSFLGGAPLLERVEFLRHLPCTIIQGRYDAVCPVVTADELARAWPEARYIVVPDAGHSAWEPGTLSELIQATESYKAMV